MRNADDSGLHHLGMFEKHLFDIPGINVEAAGDDHIFLAINDVEIAVFVHFCDIAGVQPPVGEGFRGGVGAVPITLHDLGALDQEFTGFTHRNVRDPVAKIHDTALGV